jgi:hypothetical protein
VTATEAFPEAFRRAEKSGLPSILELRIDPEALTNKRQKAYQFAASNLDGRGH